MTNETPTTLDALRRELARLITAPCRNRGPERARRVREIEAVRRQIALAGSR